MSGLSDVRSKAAIYARGAGKKINVIIIILYSIV